MLACTILSQNGEGPDPIFLVTYTFYFYNRPGRFSSHFLLSVDKMCFPSSVCESFLNKCWRTQFFLKRAKALTRYFWLFILSISTLTMDQGRFSSLFRRSVDKMCFPSSVCESFLKKCWRAPFYLKMAKVLTRFFWSLILSIFTIDRVDFPATSFYPWIKCVFLLQSVRVFSINADVHNFFSKGRRPWPDIFGYLSFQFQRSQWTGVDFPASSVDPWIKCVFLLQSVRVFSKNAGVHHFISKWRRSWPDFFGHLYIFILTIDRVDFPATSYYPGTKCVFLLQSVRVFSINADVHNFISKWRRPWPDIFGYLSFQFQRAQWTRVDFPATSIYLPIKWVFPSSGCESFLKKCDVHNIISKWWRLWPNIFGCLSFQFQRPQWTGVDFPATSFYPWIKCVFLLQSVRVITINNDVHNFISKWRRPWPFLWRDLSFQFQCPQWTGVDFPATSFYPWIKCVFLLQSVRVITINAVVHNFISKWRRPWPFLWGDLSFQFQCPQWSGVDFPATSLYPSIKCVSFFSLWEFLKTCWRGQFNLKMAKALTRFFWWFILSISTSTVDRGRFSRHFLLSEDKMCFLLQAVRVFSKNANVDNFISKWRRPWPNFLGYLSFQFQHLQWTGVDFPAPSVDPWIKCVSFFSLWEFTQKMLTCTILSPNGEGPDPFFGVIYPFNFNAHNGPG